MPATVEESTPPDIATTKVVSEFPELQGIVGGLYSKREGHCETIYKALANHYQPITQNDKVPKDMVAIVVAIADRIFTLTSFWEIDEKPSCWRKKNGPSVYTPNCVQTHV